MRNHRVLIWHKVPCWQQDILTTLWQSLTNTTQRHHWFQLDPQLSFSRSLSFLEKNVPLLGQVPLLVGLFLLDGHSSPSTYLFQSYSHGPRIKAPEYWRFFLLISRRSTNWALWCGERIVFSWIADGGTSVVTHCRPPTPIIQPRQPSSK
jgi:hypothetical protein